MFSWLQVQVVSPIPYTSSYSNFSSLQRLFLFLLRLSFFLVHLPRLFSFLLRLSFFLVHLPRIYSFLLRLSLFLIRLPETLILTSDTENLLLFEWETEETKHKTQAWTREQGCSTI
uniref:Uncharacterized protein n=1 Tax=Cacopsylla melanoneura TaxID=428564 RepID=A0A8D8U5F9_9HEMI